MGGSVTIVALGTTSSQCPWNGEVWTLNNGYKTAQKMDKLFLVHKPPGTHLDWKEIAELDVEIVSLHPLPKTTTTVYPFEKICKMFGTDYFSDTICYMLAYALYLDYKDIRMYGADFAQEYTSEKGGVEYWIGYLRGRGVRVWIAPGSSLCHTELNRPYGSDEYNRIRIWKEDSAVHLLEIRASCLCTSANRFCLPSEKIDQSRRLQESCSSTAGSLYDDHLIIYGDLS